MNGDRGQAMSYRPESQGPQVEPVPLTIEPVNEDLSPAQSDRLEPIKA